MKHMPTSGTRALLVLVTALGVTAGSLTACSSYQGPITNTPQPSGSTGISGMTRDSAP